ncbi:MAG: hypothetical protein H8E38_07330 [SAR324 cluster bacterium]|nr:hypothetical protein [SAR324 cluster bacterium]MBL7034471.1 hypothetical protein [SAR324 cluster bacterium]
MRSSGLSLDQAPPEDIPFRFFITAPVFGLLAGSFVLYRGSSLFSSSWSFETIALTHLITLGWVIMVMMGAFYQMVPVLVGGQVPWISFSRLVHALLSLGVIALIGGLLQYSPLLYPLAISTLLLAFIIFLTQLLTALFSVEAKRPIVTAMRISLVSLTFAVLLGILEIGTFSGLWPALLDRTILKSLHITLALTGAVGGLIVGVGFHVIPMFYLSSPFPQQRAVWILRTGMFSLAAVSLSLLLSANSTTLLLVTLPGVLASIIYAATVLRMLQQRKRKVVDATLRFWQIGLLAFPFSLLCLTVSFFWTDERLLFGFGLLFLLGFAVTITNGMLYKIVPFLIWFHRFSSLVGKAKVPLLKDILPEKRTRGQLHFATLALFLLLPGAILQIDGLVRIAGVCWMVSSLWLGLNLMHALRLKPVLYEQ